MEVKYIEFVIGLLFLIRPYLMISLNLIVAL